MRRSSICGTLVLAFAVLPALVFAADAWKDPAPHKQGFVTANGIKLEYLDWGGKGPALIFIHGGGDNPHAFDDLIPAFTASHRIIAYSRRGHGLSDAKKPYDTATLVEDLRGLMDALHIAKADLVGWSLGSHEITGMAGTYPQRVGRIVYLDGAYDWEKFIGPYGRIRPALVDASSEALESIEAYTAEQRRLNYTQLDDMKRVEAHQRASVIVQPDGSLKPRMTPEITHELVTVTILEPLEYAKVKVPALAIYAESFFDHEVADPKRRKIVTDWDRDFMSPLREQSIVRARKELAQLEVVRVPGSHVNFALVSRDKVVAAMRRFFGDAPPR